MDKQIETFASDDTTQKTEDIVNEILEENVSLEEKGKQICASVRGDLNTLPSYLQKIRHDIISEFDVNEEELAKIKEQYGTQIHNYDGEIKNINGKIEESNAKINKLQDKIVSLKEDRKKIEEETYSQNKEQSIKMIIGIIIILPLTVYLFVFYSSMFYSAFFRDENTTNDLNTFFDAQALINASNASTSTIVFVICAPIIFLGLGYLLHYFSKEDNKMKYVKIPAVLLVTLFLDCILAYKIGDYLHSCGIMIGKFPKEEKYTISMALSDVNTWTVIFCGFIVYIIWGFVFDATMSAYSKINVKKNLLNENYSNIKNCETIIENETKDVSEMRSHIKTLESNIRILTERLNNNVVIYDEKIEKGVNSFFVGWLQMMKALSKDKESMVEANKLFKNELDEFGLLQHKH